MPRPGIFIVACKWSRLRNPIYQCFNTIRNETYAKLLREDHELVQLNEPSIAGKRSICAIGT